VAQVKNLVTEHVIDSVLATRRDEALATFEDLVSVAEEGLSAAKEDKAELDRERLRRSGAMASLVSEKLAPLQEAHSMLVKRTQAKADSVRSDIAQTEARRLALRDESQELASSVREAEKAASSRQRASLRSLRRLRGQADSAEAAVRVLQRELRALRARVEVERAKPADSPVGPEDELLDLQSDVAQLKARVALLRAASERSPQRGKASKVRAEWAGTLRAGKDQREKAEEALSGARDAAAKAGLQLTTVIEQLLPGDALLPRAMANLTRQALQGGGQPWKDIRAAMGVPLATADAALEKLRELGILRLSDSGVVEFATPDA
jgi:chromosome segregation ATPase